LCEKQLFIFIISYEGGIKMGEGMFNKFKMLIGVEEEEEEEEEELQAVSASPVRMQQASGAEHRRYDYSDRSSTFVQPKMEPRESKVVSMQNTASIKKFKLVLIEPKSFDECPKLVDNLKSKKPVIINLENLENEKARKIFDFMSGATYAINGNVQKVANNIFVFAPENVDVLSSTETSGKKTASIIDSPWRR
jgi:cell division inhibitor SepF